MADHIWSDTDREAVAEVLFRQEHPDDTKAWRDIVAEYPIIDLRFRPDAEAVLDALTAAGWRPDGTALLSLIEDLTDDELCWFDHHGYCQAHGWMATDPECPDARAQKLLRRGETDA